MLFATTVLLLFFLIFALLLVAEYLIARRAVSPYPGLVIPCLLSLMIFIAWPIALPSALAAFLLYFLGRGRQKKAARPLTEEEKSRLEDL